MIRIAVIVALGTAAHARPLESRSIEFRRGDPYSIVVGTTFGPIITHDAGATWAWYCPTAVGYGGMFNPDYSYAASGALFATTFNGLQVMRDGCSFNATALGATFASVSQLGPDNALYVAATDTADAKVYKSIDDGMSFPSSANPGMAGDWWSSLVVAPSNAMRVYLTGYRLNASNPKVFLLLRSDNGGATFAPIGQSELITTQNSTIEIAGVSPTNPDVVFARVTFIDGLGNRALYRSDNAGASWTKLLDGDLGPLLVRKNGDLVLGLQGTTLRSPDQGATWLTAMCGPHISCLVENALGEVWACTQNYADPSPIPSDGFAVMKTTDLVTWQGVVRMQDIAGPVDCAAGTVQHDTCAPLWSALDVELDNNGASTPLDCPMPPHDDVVMPDGMQPAPSGGCCSGSGTGSMVPALVVVIALRRRRPPS